MNRKLPAYPLFVKDPYFSIWSNGDVLNQSETINWYGEPDFLEGIIRVDKKVYSFLGKSKFERLNQIDVEVSAYKTSYKFEKDDFVLEVDFVSPLTFDDLDLLSCPVCYMDYRFVSKNEHNIEVALVMHEGWCFNKGTIQNKVRGGVIELKGMETSWFGLRRQLFLSQANDAFKADWGYFYLAGKKAYFGDNDALDAFYNDKYEYFVGEWNDKYLIACSDEKNDSIYVGHDDQIAIAYFDEYLKTYYFRNGKSIFDALEYTKNEHDNINKKLEKFDQELKEECQKISSKYYEVCVASLRQSIAAHKLVENKKGELLFLSKECCSNGCIGTVDVSYPSIPLYLVYNPELVKGMLVPIFDFARMPVWKYDFAPHDVGTYPHCFGQEYGLLRKKEVKNYNFAVKTDRLDTMPPVYQYPATFDAYDFDLQMPVEECGNMIVMTYAYCKYSKDFSYALQNFDLLKKWSKYLVDFGLVPANQLCTDDFAGHVAKNINLSIKATVGIRAFAEICKELNKEEYQEYLKISKEFSNFIESKSNEKGYLPLSYEEDDEMFSLKYNLAIDKLFDFNLFSDELYNREFKEYKKHINEFGIPLDSRKEYTKSDWMLWVASFADDELKDVIIDRVNHYLEHSYDRLPFSDWYETVDSKLHYFRNRTVQGGNFFPLLVKRK